MKPTIAISMGDAAGVGPEVILKALADPDIRDLAEWRVAGSPQVMLRTAESLGLPALAPHAVLDAAGLSADDAQPGKLSAECGRAAVACIKKAAEMCVAGEADAMTTGPVNKEAVTLAGIPFTGHTEYIAEVTGARDSRMLLVSERLRVMHYAFRTEQAYRQWTRRYLRFLRDRDPDKRWVHPVEAGEAGIEAFLTHLARERRVSASTQNQALNALVFVYRQVLGVELERFDAERAKRPQRLPEVLSRREVGLLMEAMDAMHRGDPGTPSSCFPIMVRLMYGAGLRVSELTGLTVDRLHLEEGFLRVNGKGNKERVVPIGPPVAAMVQTYMDVERPRALSGRLNDALFPGRGGRGSVSRQAVFLRLKRLARAAQVDPSISPHVLRHAFATELVRGGADLRSVQALLGHADLKTTEIYTHLDRRHLSEAHRKAHPRA